MSNVHFLRSFYLSFMARLFFLTFFFGLFLIPEALSQEFKVLSFSFDPQDISAIRYPRTDVNNQGAAIVKVRTNLTGISFDCNIGFVGDPEPKTGEIWLYISPREKRIKFMKMGYITHDFLIPEVVKSGSVYLLELSGKTQFQSDPENPLGFILLKSVPSEAEVWLDGENTFRYTPFSRALSSGSHSVTLKKELYRDWTGLVQVIADSTTRLTFNLIPNFGSLMLRSSPESGASVILNGNLLDERTPLYIPKLASGEHTLVLKREHFRDVTKTIRVFSGDSLVLTIPMESSYGELLVNLPSGARLIIDKAEIYDWRKPVRLSQGEHLIEVQLDKHRPLAKTIIIGVGDHVPWKPEMIPITGKLSLESTPPEATVFIDDTYQGITPLFSESLLIGTHTVRMEKEGYQPMTKTTEVTEGRNTPVTFTLTKKTVSSRETPVTTTNDNVKPGLKIGDKAPQQTSPSQSSTSTKSKKHRDKPTFNLVLDIAYTMPSSTFWEADYNDVIESFKNGWGMGLDLRYIYANRFLGTALCGFGHFFSSKKPDQLSYTYGDPIRLNVYAVWMEQLFYYLPNRDRFYSYLGGGVGYVNGSYGRYIDTEIVKFSDSEGLLVARYGWGIRTSPKAMLELSFQYNFIFSSAGFDRQYGVVNLGIAF